LYCIVYLIQLRTNPLFAKAKQHLEIEPERSKDPNSYLRLDRCSKDSSSITQINESSNNIETFLIHSDEFNSIIDKKHKRIKSNEINQIDFKTQCRQSELELLFQVKNKKKRFFLSPINLNLSYSFRNVHNEMNKI